ncbi:MAG TPA: CerR family C-terminal domain-containing protein [Steroidobacteraceae bacterium]|nr:CerR family C-terminal domain-containing protein [Steroidobacteraceae bacterium]
MRIITAAIKLFGERGFEGASTRDIATNAGVNAPALQYYFDSKEGVYLACVEHIVSLIWEALSEAVERAEAAVRRGAGDDELIDAFCEIQAQLAEFMFTSRSADDWRLFMAQQQAGSGPIAGFQIIYQRVSKRMSEAMATIVGRLLGRPANDDETLLRTMALSGQLMVFQVARRTVLTKLDWDSINAERLALIKRVIREQTAALMRWMLASRGAARPAPRRPAGRRAIQ